jgi:hypothetical protein
LARQGPCGWAAARDLTNQSKALSQIALDRSRPASQFFSLAIVVLFGLTSFLAAALLFSVQPMIGKMALPVLGGTPAVWNTCLVYFQVVLLLGYLFVHGVRRWSRINVGLRSAKGRALAERGPTFREAIAGLHLSHNEASERRRIHGTYLFVLAILLSLGFVLQPILIRMSARAQSSVAEHPAAVLLTILGRSATLPLVMVAATAPLLQCWFALTPHPRARDPYFLYAASNAGSLLALVTYPLLIEPNLGLSAQSRAWRAGYLFLTILILFCGLAARKLAKSQADHSLVDDPDRRIALGSHNGDDNLHPPTALSIGLRWLVLVLIPSSWLMGVTTYLTTDLAAIPLLWSIPLALYLLSFVLAFAHSGRVVVHVAVRLLPFVIMPLVLVMSAGFAHAIWIPLHLFAFFVGSLACHGALAEARPPAQQSSNFYLTIAAGGLLGGVFTAIVAPLLFSKVIEYPLAMILACLVALGSKALRQQKAIAERVKDLVLPALVFVLTATLATNQAGMADSLPGVLGVMVASGLGLLACLTANRRPVRFALTAAAVLAASSFSTGASGQLLHAERSFFGVLRVTYDPKHSVRRLFHGTTLHGQQSLDAVASHEPSTYFCRSGPIGQVFAALDSRWDQREVHVAVVGLGAGTLACYARAGQRWTFYEIDPAVSRIARDARYFTYLRDSQATTTRIVEGDARLRLREAPDHSYQLIVLDAFSSDSLPVHLVSREAIQLYTSKLAEGGVLAFNLSNRYLDLEPVMGRQAADTGLFCLVGYDTAVTAAEKEAGKQPSIWAVMAEREHDLVSLVSDSRWRRPLLRPNTSAWTDDYSDIVSAIHWLPRRPGKDHR